VTSIGRAGAISYSSDDLIGHRIVWRTNKGLPKGGRRFIFIDNGKLSPDSLAHIGRSAGIIEIRAKDRPSETVAFILRSMS
jgi:hypothetical protein